MMIQIILCVMALALSATFWGKSIVGIGMGLATILSVVALLVQKHQYDWSAVKRGVLSIDVAAVACMFLVWLVSAFYALDQSIALDGWVKFFAMAIGGCLILMALSRQGSFDFSALFKVASVVGALASLVMIISPYVPFIESSWRSSYGSVLAMLFPFSFYVLSVSGKSKPLWFVVTLLIVGGVLASGGRTAWITLAVTMIGAFVFIPWMAGWKRVMGIVLFCACCVPLINLGVQANKVVVGEEAFEYRVQAMGSMERPASGRLTVWKNTWVHVVDHPWLGVGIEGSKALNIKKSDVDFVAHPHNIVMELLVETGFVGFIAFCAFIALVCYRYGMAYIGSADAMVKKQSVAIFVGFVGYGVASMSLTSFFHTWWYLYGVAFVVLIYAFSIRAPRA